MSNAALIRGINIRFGFSYLYPEGWKRFESENSDGVRFVAAGDGKATIYAFGQYAVATKSLDELVKFTISSESRNPGFQLLADELTAVSVESPATDTVQVTGRRVMFQRLGDCDLTTIQSFAQFGDIQFSLCCEAPSSEYSVYEHLFSDVLRGWKIVGVAE